MMLAVPTIQLIIMPLAANFDVKNVNIAFTDHDHSTYSQKLISKIGASALISASNACGDAEGVASMP